MTYSEYKQAVGDLIMAGRPAVHAHWIAITGQGISKEQADRWWAMFVMEHRG